MQNFGLQAFLFLDSTLFLLDSTFWLDPTIKLNHILESSILNSVPATSVFFL